jgi:hypothetical protein
VLTRERAIRLLLGVSLDAWLSVLGLGRACEIQGEGGWRKGRQDVKVKEGRTYCVKPPTMYFSFDMFLCPHTGQSTGAANLQRQCNGVAVLHLLRFLGCDCVPSAGAVVGVWKEPVAWE